MQSVRVLVSQPWVICGLLVVGALSLRFAGAVGRRCGRPPLLAGLALASLGGIPVLTLYPAGPLGRFPQNCVGSLLQLPGARGLFETHDALLNVLLFVPAGLLVSLLTRRAARTVGGLVLLSFAIEATQGVLGNHSCTNTDWWANTAGALLGGFVASVAVSLGVSSSSSQPVGNEQPQKAMPGSRVT